VSEPTKWKHNILSCALNNDAVIVVNIHVSSQM